MAVSSQRGLQSFTSNGRAAFLPLSPRSHRRVPKQGGLDCVRHVAAQKLMLKDYEVSGLLQARGSAKGPSQNGNSRVVVLWRRAAARTDPGVVSLGCASSELPRGETTGACLCRHPPVVCSWWWTTAAIGVELRDG